MLARNTAKAKRGILMEPWSQALGKMESWLKKVANKFEEISVRLKKFV